MKTPNPHEAPLGEYLRALARPIDSRPYFMASDGSLHQRSFERSDRRARRRQLKEKFIKTPRFPRRSWADVQAAWRRRKEAE